MKPYTFLLAMIIGLGCTVGAVAQSTGHDPNYKHQASKKSTAKKEAPELVSSDHTNYKKQFGQSKKSSKLKVSNESKGNSNYKHQVPLKRN